MFAIDRLILLAAVLLLAGVASSKLSSRVGVPVLVLFLGIGMLAGSEGIGGIDFENYVLAHAVGVAALAAILFDAGLRTPAQSVRSVLWPALSLATIGVLLTAAIVGLAAVWVLGIPPLDGLLFGAIVGSTDAAAVFATMRSQGISVAERTSATVEVESGANDPMAVFLTLAILELGLGRQSGAGSLFLFFLRQAGVGLVAGVLVGRGAAWFINRIRLDSAGLYPVVTAATGLLAYGLPASLHGSGFLSVYIAGIVLGNRRIVFRNGILLFHDGAAWLAQISMFVLLGLLSFPSRVLAVAVPGLVLGLVLMLLARPLAVATVLLPFRFSLAEIAFISWAGLKGAVPIVLATFPLLLGHARGQLLFNTVFVVVLLSAATQGWSLAWLTRRLGLERPTTPRLPVTLEIAALRDVEGEIVEYAVDDDARAAGRTIRELALPDRVVVALVVRGGELIPPRGSTRVLPGDHAFVVLRPEARPLVDHVFSSADELPPLPAAVEFPLLGSTTVGELEEFYGIQLGEAPHTTLDELLRRRLHRGLREGASVDFGPLTLLVRELADGRIERVGLVIG